MEKILAVIFDDSTDLLRGFYLCKAILEESQSDSMVMQLHHVRMIIKPDMTHQEVLNKYTLNAVNRNEHIFDNRLNIKTVDVMKNFRPLDEKDLEAEMNELVNDVFGGGADDE